MVSDSLYKFAAQLSTMHAWRCMGNCSQWGKALTFSKQRAAPDLCLRSFSHVYEQHTPTQVSIPSSYQEPGVKKSREAAPVKKPQEQQEASDTDL